VNPKFPPSENMHDQKSSLPVALRSWRVIARELTAETNPAKIVELLEELDRALDKQELGKKCRGGVVATNGHVTNTSGWSNYEKIVDDALTLMRADYASMQMLYPERGTGGGLRLLAFRGFNPQAAKFWEWVRADSKSTCGIALRTSQRVIAPDIAACDFMDHSEDQQVYLQTGIHACQTTPLIVGSGNVVGMISTHWRTSHKPSEKDLLLFDALAMQAADLIERCG
jgi:GAF domain-containing protein